MRQTTIWDEMVIDNFAGGGGASTGIEAALGRAVDVAINHDSEAIAMHKANHPHTQHYIEDVFQVDPLEVTGGRAVGLLWASPDCTHFSRARGGKPNRPKSKKRRGLIWVVGKWMARVRPRIVFIENVLELLGYGPLDSEGNVIPELKGSYWDNFVRMVRRFGYVIEWKRLKVCDYGTPTARERLFVIARCDGQPIVWPEPTHGPAESEAVKSGRLLPWRSTAECIDWSIPCPSIFERRKPLADATLRRIARGIQKFVLDAKEPFIVSCNHQGGDRTRSVNVPMNTLTSSRDANGLVVPTLVQTGYGERKGQKPRILDINKPCGTQVAEGIKHALAVALLIKNFGGHGAGPGIDPRKPSGTITTQDHHSLVTANLVRNFGNSDAADINEPVGSLTAGGGGKTSLMTSHLVKLYGTCRHGQAVTDPAPTITANGQHVAEVRAFLQKYYGNGFNAQSLTEPAPTNTTKDRTSLVTVTIEGDEYIIVDIGMRMLKPREQYLCQGFPADYIINPIHKGKRLSQTAQTRMCGNSVPPQVVEALVRANYTPIEVRKRA